MRARLLPATHRAPPEAHDPASQARELARKAHHRARDRCPGSGPATRRRANRAGYQEHHIAVRHGVTGEPFEAVWVERVDLVVRHDGSYESVGATDDGREVYLVWRWDIFGPERVFPITAYFLPDEG